MPESVALIPTKAVTNSTNNAMSTTSNTIKTRKAWAFTHASACLVRYIAGETLVSFLCSLAGVMFLTINPF